MPQAPAGTGPPAPMIRARISASTAFDEREARSGRRAEPAHDLHDTGVGAAIHDGGSPSVQRRDDALERLGHDRQVIRRHAAGPADGHQYGTAHGHTEGTQNRGNIGWLARPRGRRHGQLAGGAGHDGGSLAI